VRLQRDVTRHDDGTLGLGPLARYVLDHQIHLEMAPTCHVQVGAVASFEQHPIAMFLRHGLNVGVNTNRLMSDVMPSSELMKVTNTFGLTSDEVEQLVTNAVMSSFAPIEARRQIVAAQVHPWFEENHRVSRTPR
jgi:adenosine deaminase